MIGHFKHRPHEAFAPQEGRGRDRREAGIAVGRRGAIAEAGSAGLHHLAVVVADGQVLVERHARTASGKVRRITA